MSGRRFTAAVVSVPLVLAVAAIVLQGLDGRSFFRDSEALGALAFIGFALVGAIILTVDPGHRMGRLFYSAGTLAILVWLADNYARYSIQEGLHLPGELLAAWLQNWMWFLPIGLIFSIGLLLFPDGTLPGPRWRPLLWFAWASLTSLTLAFMFHDEALDGFPAIPNPTGWLTDDLPLAGIAFGGVVVSILGGVAGLAWRFKRSSGIQRLQMKWVVYAAVMLVVTNLAIPVLGPDVSERVADLIFGASTLLLPVACGIAILKYRLYEIDVIVNRTLVYGALTAVLAVTYLVLVVVLQGLLQPLTRESDLAIAGSTLAVAALFRPLRARVQSFIDRRFYRRKYDAAKTLDRFSSRLRDEVDLDSLTEELVTVVGATMQPRHASLWLRDPAALERAAV